MCGFADTMVLVAKEGYAPSIAPSALKRRASLLCRYVKIMLKIARKFAESKKTRIFVMSIRKEVKMKT